MGLATRLASKSGGSYNAESRVVKDFALVNYGAAILAMMVVVVGLSNTGAVDAQADPPRYSRMFVFGDSYEDNGNIPKSVRPTPWSYPYGETWPGYPTGRWSDGYNQMDIFVQMFGLPEPTPYRLVLNNSLPNKAGIDFAVAGAGVTFAYGSTPFDTQVDQMETFVQNGVVLQGDLLTSVVLINFGLNDYDYRNSESPSFQTSAYFGIQELEITVANEVDIIAANIVRLYALGLRKFVVTNLPLLVCIPLSEQAGMYKSCSTNTTLLNETSLHTSLLQNRVSVLKQALLGVDIVIADQTKAFGQLFNNGSAYGFVDPLVPCCYGDTSQADLYSLSCGNTDSNGAPLYTLCNDPSKAVLWDPVHPTEAAWKVVVGLFFNVPGYTLEGPMLSIWT